MSDPPRVFFDRPRHQVLVGDKDVSERCDSIVYSATDTGGFEIATLGLPSVDRPKKGTAITIRQGLEVAWAGRVAEISDHSQHGLATKTTGCEGLRAVLRDALYSMVYADRDLSQWSGPSLSRQIAMLSASLSLAQSQAAQDPTNGLPALVQTLTDSWVSPFVPMAEAWYDAGPGNLIAKLYYNALTGTAAAALAGVAATLFLSSDDLLSTNEATTSLISTVGTAAYFAPQTPYRRAAARLSASTPGGAQGGSYQQFLRNLTAYGNHGLTPRGPDPGGFYPSDIARHALTQCPGVVAGRIVDAIGYVAPHVVYRTPTAADVIVDDMAKLMGWPWGVWEPIGVMGTQPRLDFCPPPADATAVVTKADCDQLDITSRLGDLYDVCEVMFTDPAKGAGIVSVRLPNPQLYEAGITTRTLLLNVGASTAAAASTFALFALALSQIAARAAGSATLPVAVRLPYGGSKPACLLRPGLDRLRIVDLVDGGSLLDLGTVRRDVFRISRVETTVSKDGTPSTVVELDSGSNLLETLQARLAISAGVVASGASGG